MFLYNLFSFLTIFSFHPTHQICRQIYPQFSPQSHHAGNATDPKRAVIFFDGTQEVIRFLTDPNRLINFFGQPQKVDRLIFRTNPKRSVNFFDIPQEVGQIF